MVEDGPVPSCVERGYDWIRTLKKRHGRTFRICGPWLSTMIRFTRDRRLIGRKRGGSLGCGAA
jgi:hypothetical protein